MFSLYWSSLDTCLAAGRGPAQVFFRPFTFRLSYFPIWPLLTEHWNSYPSFRIIRRCVSGNKGIAGRRYKFRVRMTNENRIADSRHAAHVDGEVSPIAERLNVPQRSADALPWHRGVFLTGVFSGSSGSLGELIPWGSLSCPAVREKLR